MATMAVPPRQLVLKALALATDAVPPPQTNIVDGIPELAAGDVQLYSFFQPSLQGGQHTIQVSQDVALDGPSRRLTARKDSNIADQGFYVVAPQFEIPAEDFHSTYPAQGHADQPSIAPHVVFNDVHLPWERAVWTVNNDPDNLVPWLAVFPFDCNRPSDPELRLSDDQLADIRSALNIKDERKLSSALTLTTTIKDYMNLPRLLDGSTNSRIKVRVPDFSKDGAWGTISTNTTPIEVIFLKGKLFRQLFYSQDSQNSRPDLSSFRYCAHVRNINTTGVTGAGVVDTGLFSVVHSKRSGPTDIAQGQPPRSQAVHLLSLEYLSSLESVADNEHIAMISLYRWNYLCQPPLSVNFIDLMRDIGIQIKYSQDSLRQTLDESEKRELTDNIRDTPPNSYLRCPAKALAAVEKANFKSTEIDPLKAIRGSMIDRLKKGYTVTRYRVHSGEETVGLFRGALLPVRPGEAPTQWPFSSNNAQDYQIFDKVLGIMDISYASAWQLGRLMASSDIAFVSALMRIRTRSYQSGVTASGISSAHDAIGLKSQAHFFSTLPNTLETMAAVSAPGATTGIDLRSRWDRQDQVFDTRINSTAFQAGSGASIAQEGSVAGTNGSIPFQDLFAPTSLDWKTIHDWILDKMFLAGIPSHYLIADPSYLPPESIRFFHIDNNWMDCFIDGALSCANHTALHNQDAIREQIKNQFNEYLKNPVLKDPLNPNSEKLHAPQVPIYGFFLRSAVVSAFKDLIVEVPFSKEVQPGGRAPILRQVRLGPEILMVLLDRLPDGGEIASIKFTQPPHQQRFCIADYLGEQEATYLFRRVFYNATPVDPFLSQFNTNVIFKPNDEKSVYDWQSRCLNFTNLHALFFDRGFHSGDFNEISTYFTTDQLWQSAPQRLTSALIGIQLNDTMKYLQIIPPTPTSATPTSRQPYQIRTRASQDAVLKARTALDTIAAKRFNPQTATLAFNFPNNDPVITPQQQTSGLPLSSRAKIAASLGIRNDTAVHDHPYLAEQPSTSQVSITPPVTTDVASTTPAPSIGRILAAAPAPPPDKPVKVITMCFNYTIFPREVPRSQVADLSTKLPNTPTRLPATDGFVYRDAGAPADIVFSVSQNRAVTRFVDSAQIVRLRMIKFSLPLGSVADRSAEPKLSRDMAASPGFAPPGSAASAWRVRILSNQRWVVVIDPGRIMLSIRIIPRNMNKSEPFVNCNELSFILSGLDTGWTALDSQNPDGAKPGNIAVTEYYGWTEQTEQGNPGRTLTVNRMPGWAQMQPR